jgi:hypothetical protein
VSGSSRLQRFLKPRSSCIHDDFQAKVVMYSCDRWHA